MLINCVNFIQKNLIIFIQKVIEAFIFLYVNNDGFLKLDEVKNGCAKIKEFDLNKEELFNSFDSDKSGAINYTEFLAAAI